MTTAQQTAKTEPSVARPDFGPDNFQVEIGADNVLTIRVDLNRVTDKTASGNDRIASSGGNRTIDNAGTKLGLNIYRKPSGKK